MKNKKIIISALVAVIMLGAGALYVPVTRAATNVPLFGTTTLLGINLLMGNSGGANSVMTLVDFSSAPTTNQNYTLPSVVGKSGQIIVVKPFGAVVGNDGTFLNVYPASGELLEGSSGVGNIPIAAWGLVGGAIFIADPANNTWWVVSKQ